MSQYATVIIKPDAVIDQLEESLINDLEDYGFRIIFQKYWRVSLEDVQIVHTDLFPKDPYFRYIVANYSMHESSLIIVEYSGDRNIYDYLSKIKGNPKRKDSIRGRHPLLQKIVLYDDQRVDIATVKNRIHCSDNEKESIDILCTALSFIEILCLPQYIRKKVLLNKFKPL